MLLPWSRLVNDLLTSQTVCFKRDDRPRQPSRTSIACRYSGKTIKLAGFSNSIGGFATHVQLSAQRVGGVHAALRQGEYGATGPLFRGKPIDCSLPPRGAPVLVAGATAGATSTAV